LWNKWGQIKEAQSRAEIEQLVRTVRTPSELSQKIEALARNEKLRQQKLEELTLKEQEAKDKQWKKKLLRTTVLASLIGSSD
jgi:uncharacterized membrane protein